MILFTSIPALAAEHPVTFSSTITVTEDGGSYQVGFVDIVFKKNFIEADRLPAVFNVEIYAENGTAYIEFKPDTEGFLKDVHLKVDDYKGPLYDKAKGKNIKMDIRKQQIVAEHFSRYAFR
jgi:hypothetical protein